MSTVEELNEQSRLAVIAYLQDTENVKLEFAVMSDKHSNMFWTESNGKVNMIRCYYRIAPKKLWYRVALTFDGENYYTMSATTAIQQSNIESRADFIKWLTPNKVYFSLEDNT